MKLHTLLLFIGLIPTMTACKDIDPGVESLTVKMKINYDEAFNGYSFPLENIKLTITSVNTQQSTNVATTSTGEALFTGVIPGNYDIDAVVTIPATTYQEATGIVTTENVVFNASIKNQLINTSTISTIPQLVLKAGRVGDWLIKQVYYAGSHRTDGALYRDQFIEIFNNSNEILYADQMYIGEALGNASTTFDATRNYFLPNGQWDWTKSIGMPTSVTRANEDYFYTKSLYRIGGNGTTYPVKPGESIVIAQSAQNHKSPFVSNDGTSITVRNPALTIDLSNADFEVYLAPLLAKPLDSDIDNPKVPNLEVLTYFGTDYILDNPGRNGFFIFKTTDKVEAYPQYPAPNTTTISSTTKYYYQIPNKYVIDAVETQPGVSEQVPKKFAANFDAGFAFVPKGSYSSQSIIRKTSKVIGTRRVLQDTNNSSNDFDYFDLANPRGFK